MEEFIQFILELVDDEFFQFIASVPSKYYFLNGGCLELAKVLKYYYPEGKIVINEERNHIAFCYQNTVYDANGISKEKTWQEIEDILYIEDLIGNKEIYFEKKKPSEAIIQEIKKIDMSHIKNLTKVPTSQTER